MISFEIQTVEVRMISLERQTRGLELRFPVAWGKCIVISGNLE
jgi:hypothetical protein